MYKKIIYDWLIPVTAQCKEVKFSFHLISYERKLVWLTGSPQLYLFHPLNVNCSQVKSNMAPDNKRLKILLQKQMADVSEATSIYHIV